MDAKRKKGRRDLEKEKFWRELMVQRQHNGGQSVHAFCEERGVTESQFYRWRTELRVRDAERSAPAGPTQVVSARAKPRRAGPSQTSGFVELVQPTGTGSGAGVSVRINERIDIVLDRGFDAQTLKMAMVCLLDSAHGPVHEGRRQ